MLRSPGIAGGPAQHRDIEYAQIGPKFKVQTAAKIELCKAISRNVICWLMSISALAVPFNSAFKVNSPVMITGTGPAANTFTKPFVSSRRVAVTSATLVA